MERRETTPEPRPPDAVQPQGPSAGRADSPPAGAVDPAAPCHEMARLLGIIDRLRAPDGCPWDREQTETSMAPHLLEEAYEAIEAIERGGAHQVREELGDVLMNVLMIARIGAEGGRFDSEQVAAAIADKLIRRHPHVFGDVRADSSAEVLQNWEAIKREERAAAQEQTAAREQAAAQEQAPAHEPMAAPDRPATTAGAASTRGAMSSSSGGAPARGGAAARQDRTGALSGVPKALPALLRALRTGEKAARLGFDWPEAHGPRAKVDEELRELDRALQAGDRSAVEAELGDVLFSLVNVARHAGVNPEMALRSAVNRFARRFAHVEEVLGERLPNASLAEMEALWQEAKRHEGEEPP